MSKKQISRGERVPLKLTPTETKVILEELMCLDREYTRLFQEAPTGKPVMMTLDDLEDFGGYIAAEANHTSDKRLGRKLDRVFDKCQRLLETYTDDPGDAITYEQATQKLIKGTNDSQPGKKPARSSSHPKSRKSKLAKFPIKVTQHQRDSLLQYTQLKATVKKRVESVGEGTNVIEFTKKELDHLLDETGQARIFAPSPHKQRLAAIQKKVDDALEQTFLEDFGYERPDQREQPEIKSDRVIQLKVSLLECRPSIWRRIQTKDCTLGDLHEHIQRAMGWQDCHMHEFVIEGETYGAAMEDDFDFGLERKDESTVRLSEFLPDTGKRFRFQYMYDFGDNWRHEVLFEGYPSLEKAKKYPLCVEGERACPPEDIGGPWGYADYLEALSDPSHERHDEFIEWMGVFDAETFSIEKATRAMRKGLPAF